jgi:hypothetical protein
MFARGRTCYSTSLNFSRPALIPVLLLLTAWASPVAAERGSSTLTLIEGTYEITGTQPDGDSVHFCPFRAEDWKLLRGRAVKPNRRGCNQLRLEGIDALETHYTPKARASALGVMHQPLDLARAASAELLKRLGFEHVERRGETVQVARPARVTGYILAETTDTFGRPLAFAFRGEHSGDTGDRVALDDQAYAASVNHHLLVGGFVYPAFYSSIHDGVRRAMVRDVGRARSRARGIWQKDRSTLGFTVPERAEELPERAYIAPKLFRRLADYVAARGTGLDGFASFLAERRGDRVLVTSEGHERPFASLVVVEGRVVRLSKPVEELVFVDD